MICSIAGCHGPVKARGWCDMHYRRYRRHGDPTVLKRPGRAAGAGATCSVAGCDQPLRMHGFCNKHYLRWKRHGDPNQVNGYGGRGRQTHGMSGTPTYGSWISMIRRCGNPNHSAYRYYGGRGIKVCQRWLTFEHFLEDMGVRPSGATLGRFGDVGDYEPDNCAWMTSAEQRVEQTKKAQASETHRKAA